MTPSASPWPLTRLGDVTTRVGSGSTPRGGAAVYRSAGRPFVRSQNVGRGRLALDDLAHIDEATHRKLGASEIHAGDVLLTITGASIGRSAVADERVAGGNVNQHVCEIRLDRSRFVPEFVCQFLLTRAGQDQIDSFQAGSNRQGLNFGQIRAIKVPEPPPNEQRAIARAVDDATDLVASLEALIAKKRAGRQALLARLLTGRTRLPGFSAPWTAERLGSVGSFVKGRGIRRDDVRADGVPCIRYGDIYTRYSDYVSAPVSHVEAAVAASALPISGGDLVFAGSGETAEEIGKCVAYTGERAAVAGGDTVVVRLKAQHDPVFLASLVNGSKARRQKARLAQGNAVVHISASALESIEIALPDPREQRAIAEIVRDADAEIEALQSQLAKAGDIRTGMMQQLLTGRTRLVGDGTPVEVAA